MAIPKEYEDLLEKYKKKLERELGTAEKKQGVVRTKEYEEFRKEFLPRQLGVYEKLCKFSENILKVKPDIKRGAELKEAIDICHLHVSPAGTTSFSLLFPILFGVLAALVSFLAFGSLFFPLFFLILAVIAIKPFDQIPIFLSNNWRLKTSNQMVLCIFYVVTYMRHTSNLELAVRFAADHLGAPLGLDLKKVMWDIETAKYSSIKESLDSYLEGWKKWNMEFVESFHLIEGSLYEGSEERRLNALDKALTVMLEETYEKMLHYAHNLKNPITMLHMLGIILPILGLVILPLLVSFMPEVKWYHLAMLYDITLPLLVYYLGKTILSKRPTGYGDRDIAEENPQLKKYRNILIRIGRLEIKIHPIWIASFVFIILFLIGISPLILHGVGFPEQTWGNFELLGYRMSSATEGPTVGKMVGPYGIGATILSIFLVLSFALSLGIYYKLRSKNVIKIRENSKKLEREFGSALFQLGNRLGDGIPAEIAFDKVSSVMSGTLAGRFFEIVAMNIRRLGMSVKEAIFNPKSGALVYFPSNIIEGSMKVLIVSVKKGPRVAAQALINISRYIKEMHKVNERLKDLLADVISSMKSQINFLAPIIAGIVIGITSMITNIIGKLSGYMGTISAEGGAGAGAGLSGFAGLFGDGIPTYFFQIIVGIYIVEMIWILTVIENGIENGSDKLNERYLLGRNMIKSLLLYSAVALIIMIVFNSIAGQIMAETLAVS